MPEFLDAADLALKTGRIDPEEKDHFERVFRAIGKLQQVHSKNGSLDLVNVESVFGAFEMAQTLRTFPGLNADEIQLLVESMTRVIVATVELGLAYGQRPDGINSPAPYGDFAKLLADLASKTGTVAVLTFNYDTALEHAIIHTHSRRDVFYALEGDEAPKGATTFLKLHGSLNWFHCEGDVHHPHHAVAWPIRDALRSARQLKSHREGFSHFRLNPSQFTPPCGGTIGPAVIVPPTWSKGEYHRQIANVWARAARELNEAENIIVVGYSLPASDSFFPLLYGLGTVGDTPLHRFWVFDPDESVGVRFSNMLGPGARQRFRHWYKELMGHPHPVPVRFNEAIAILKKELC